MNILQVQDRLKGLSEQQLATEMQSPSGMAPQFLVLTELQRRKRVRDDFQAQSAKAPATTVAQDAVAAAGVPQEGLAPMARAMAPNTDVTQNTGIAALPAATASEEPQRMAGGGMVRKMKAGRSVDDFHPEVFTDSARRTMATRQGMSVRQWLNSMDPSVAANYAQGAVERANTRYGFSRRQPSQWLPDEAEPPPFEGVNPSYEEQTTSRFPDEAEAELTGLAREAEPLYPPMPAGNPIPGARPEGGFYDQPERSRLSPLELIRQRMAMQDRMMGTEPPQPTQNVPSPMDRIRERMRLEEAQQRQRDFARDRMMGTEPPLPKAVPEVEKARAEGRESFTLGELLGDYGVTVGLDGTGAQAVPGPGRGALPAAAAASEPSAAAQPAGPDTPRPKARPTDAVEDLTAAADTGGGGGGGAGSGGVGGGGSAGPQTDYEKALADALARTEKRAEQDKWMAVAQAGLALMASDNPSLAGALGEAGLTGLESYRGSRDAAEKARMDLLATQYGMDMDKQKMAMARAQAAGGGGKPSKVPLGIIKNYEEQRAAAVQELEALGEVPEANFLGFGGGEDPETAQRRLDLANAIAKLDYALQGSYATHGVPYLGGNGSGITGAEETDLADPE